MFSVQLCQMTQLYINAFLIVDLKRPFHRIVGNTKSVDTLLRSPSESLSRQKKPLTYYVKFSETRAGSLFNSEVSGLPCHWLYNTNASVSPLFRDKALMTLLHVLDTTEDETYEEIRKYLGTILHLVWTSFPFDCIVTSIHTLKSLLPDIPIVHMPLILTSLPKRTALPSVRHETLQAILKGHPEGIPLPLLTGESYNFLSLRHTSFERNLLQEKKHILVIEGTNTAYAGFLSRELRFLPWIKEVLPVCLFHINKQ